MQKCEDCRHNRNEWCSLLDYSTEGVETHLGACPINAVDINKKVISLTDIKEIVVTPYAENENTYMVSLVTDDNVFSFTRGVRMQEDEHRHLLAERIRD